MKRRETHTAEECARLDVRLRGMPHKMMVTHCEAVLDAMFKVAAETGCICRLGDYFAIDPHVRGRFDEQTDRFDPRKGHSVSLMKICLLLAVALTIIAGCKYDFRNSLFLRRRVVDGSYEWRLILTTGSDWRIPDGLGRWCSAQTESLKRCFFVRKARFAADGRHLWLVCDTYTYTFSVVCSYDVHDRIFRALIDGADVEDAADGTILVKDKKFYPDDDRGAVWHDVWITPDGKVVREGEITLRGSDL